MLWAAVLRAGPGAALSHDSAAELDRLADAPSRCIHVTVDSRRQVALSSREGLGQTQRIIIHRSTRLDQARHPARTPPRTRIEDAVLLLADRAAVLPLHAGRLLALLDHGGLVEQADRAEVVGGHGHQALGHAAVQAVAQGAAVRTWSLRNSWRAADGRSRQPARWARRSCGAGRRAGPGSRRAGARASGPDRSSPRSHAGRRRRPAPEPPLVRVSSFPSVATSSSRRMTCPAADVS